jgi:hypothetical protein
MYRLADRNFGDHEALVVDHSVDTDGADHAGIRWYELNKTTGNWSIAQQGTYAPADGLHRWMGSTAMDNDGNLAIGFSTRNGTAPNYPSIAYAGRLATDPPGQFSQGEATLIAGTGSQLAGRWGDYSLLTVDPVDDCTFWYTSEYLTTTGGAPRGGRGSDRSGSRPARAGRRHLLLLRRHHRHHLRRRHLRRRRRRHRHRHRRHHYRRPSVAACRTCSGSG